MRSNRWIALVMALGALLSTPFEDANGQGPCPPAQSIALTKSGAGPNANGTTEGFIPARNHQDWSFDESTTIKVHSGEVCYSKRVFNIPAKGMSFEWVLSYRSQVDYDWTLGANWTHNWDQFVYVDNGKLHHFDGTRFAVDTYPITGTYSECDTPGVYRKASLGASSWQIRDRSGYIWTFAPLNGSAAQGRLTSCEDSFGNHFDVSYDACGRVDFVLDTVGRTIDFAYDANTGRLVAVTDFAGRAWSVAQSNGRLDAITTPPITSVPCAADGSSNDFPLGRSIGFAYDGNANLTAVTFPNQYPSGDPGLTFQYSGDRVSAVTAEWIDFDAVVQGGSVGFAYDLPARETTVTDRKGFVREYAFDLDGHPLSERLLTQGLRPTDPADYTTTMTYNAHGELVTRSMPKGDYHQYVYPNTSDLYREGNAIKITHFPAHPSAMAKFVTKPRFDPVYNRPIRSIDSGYAAILDYQEGDPNVTGLNALVQKWGIDLNSIALNLGDINGDGPAGSEVVDQIGGRVIRRTSPLVESSLGPSFNIVEVFTFDDAGRTITETSGEGAVTVHEYAPDAQGGLVTKIVSDADPATAPPTAGTSFWTKPASLIHVAAIEEFAYDSVGNLVERTDPRGVKSTLTRNTIGEVVQKTRGTGTASYLDPVLGRFNAIGLSHFVTPGHAKCLQYDANGNVVAEHTSNEGAGDSTNLWITESYVHSRQNQILLRSLEISEGNNSVSRYDYDDNGNQIRHTDPEGHVDTWLYDERNLLFVSVQGSSDPITASTTTRSYNENGKLTVLEGPEDLDGDTLLERTLYTYDDRDRLTITTSPTGTQRIELYNDADSNIGFKVLGRPGGVAASANDTSGNVLLRERRIVRNSLGEAAKTIEKGFLPSGQSGSLPYTYQDFEIEVVYLYDRDRQVVKLSHPHSGLQIKTYDGMGRLTSETDAVGNRIDYRLDKAGNRVVQHMTEVDGQGVSSGETKTIWTVIDGLGRVHRRTDNQGRSNYFVYDARNNLVCEADSATTQPTRIDPVGLVPTWILVNLPGNTSRFLFDGRKRVVQSARDQFANGEGDGLAMLLPGFDPSAMIGSSEITSEVTYDKNGNVKQLNTGTDGVMTFEYDAQDRLVRKDLADGTYFLTNHWKTGHVKSHRLHLSDGTLFRGLSHHYDGDGAETITAVDPMSQSEGSTIQTFERNGTGRLTKITDDNGVGVDSVVEQIVDSRGTVLQETQNGKVVSRQLNSVGQVESLHYPNGRTVDYSYNADFGLNQISEGGANIATFGYMGNDRVERITFGNQVEQSVSQFSDAGDPLDIEHTTASGALLSEVDYTVDAAGRRTNESRVLYDPPGTVGSALEDQMVYDSASRLRKFFRDVDSSGSPDLEQSYDLDDDSNWLSLTLQATATYLFSPNPVFSLDTVANQGVDHDPAGNRNSDLWFDYFYDAHDRLVRVAIKDTTDSVLWFDYDGFGRRTEKRFLAPNSTLWTKRFYYSGDNVIEERDGLDGVVGQYVLGDGVDELLQMKRDTDRAVPGMETYYFLHNAVGSTVALTDDSGNVVERVSYDAYGAPRFVDSSGSSLARKRSAFGNPYLFTGREYDHEFAVWKVNLGTIAGYYSEWSDAVGQYYYRARYMDPSEGRFVSRDPLAPANNSSADPSLTVVRRIVENGYTESPYAYVGNGPHNGVDPMGLDQGMVRVPKDLVGQGLGNRGGWMKKSTLDKIRNLEKEIKAAKEAAEKAGKGFSVKGFLKKSVYGYLLFAGIESHLQEYLGEECDNIVVKALTKVGCWGLSFFHDDDVCLSMEYDTSDECASAIAESHDRKCPGDGPSTPGPSGPAPPGGGGGGSTDGPSTPGPSGPGAPGPSKPGDPKPDGPKTPGPKGPSAPGGGGTTTTGGDGGGTCAPAPIPENSYSEYTPFGGSKPILGLSCFAKYGEVCGDAKPYTPVIIDQPDFPVSPAGDN